MVIAKFSRQIFVIFLLFLVFFVCLFVFFTWYSNPIFSVGIQISNSWYITLLLLLTTSSLRGVTVVLTSSLSLLTKLAIFLALYTISFCWVLNNNLIILCSRFSPGKKTGQKHIHCWTPRLHKSLRHTLPHYYTLLHNTTHYYAHTTLHYPITLHWTTL